jgi:UDP-glucose 4-epimerase
MAILVTGGAGYIGSHMAYALCDRGEDVVVLDDLSTGRRAAVPAAARFVEGSTGDEALLASLIPAEGIESIVHFAASIVVPESVAYPLAYYRNNTANSRTLIAAAVDGGVRHFVFSSTAAVYGEPERVPVAEPEPASPQSPYGWSKLMTEIMLRDAGRAHGLGHVVLRYFNVAGADPAGRTGQSTPEATHLIKVAVQTALGLRPKMTVFGTDYPTPDGTGVRDYIHVADLIEAHLAALDHLRAGGRSDTFNCGYGRGFSVLDVIAAVKRVSGRDFVVEMAGRRPGDPAAIVADSSRIRATLAWAPRFDDLDTIVRHALAWEEKLQVESSAA